MSERKKSVVKDGKKFYLHFLYTNYGSTKNGEIMNFKTNKMLMGFKSKDGSRRITLSQSPIPKKTMQVNRFIYECFYGKLPDNVIVSYKNGNKDDNRLVNLQMESSLKTVKKLATNIDSNIDYDSELSDKDKIAIDKAYVKMMKSMKRQNINPKDLM